MTEREITFAQAILEATDQSMAADSNVYVMGLGVPDPKGIFGTTLGLEKKYGSQRVLDMPAAENGMTGVAIGSALCGLRPIMTHQRVDFILLAMEQIVNQAAKWHYMFAGRKSIPLVVRMIIGRGWGQGPHHSQSLQSWFAHIPGLKVIMPFSPKDAKGLLISSIQDNNPVIFIEHRWLYGIKGPVPEEMYSIPIGKASVLREGRDLTLVGISHMTYEALKAADILADGGISAEVIDMRSLRPWDEATVIKSVRKTGRIIVIDPAWKTCGFAGEIVARIAEETYDSLKFGPVRITLPEHPLPTSPALTKNYYPDAMKIVENSYRILGKKMDLDISRFKTDIPHDVPDLSFKGPF